MPKKRSKSRKYSINYPMLFGRQIPSRPVRLEPLTGTVRRRKKKRKRRRKKKR